MKLPRSIWYNPDTDEIAIQLYGWHLFEIQFLRGYLHFIPKKPWMKIGDL